MEQMLWRTSYEKFQKVCSQLRNIFLFEWLSNAYQFLYLSSIDMKYLPVLVDLKTSLCIVDVAVDDACDNADLIKKAGGEEFTHEILNLLYNINKIVNNKNLESPHINNEYGKEYYTVLYGILKDVIDLLKTLPRFNEFKNEFISSMRNVCHAMEFSYIVNKGESIYPFSYLVEHRSASTMVAVHSIVDLMASPDFDKKNIGKLIPMLHMADTVAMLSNTINTWPREILEKDYSSPVLALALEKGLITFNEFYNISPSEIESKLSPLSDIIEQAIDKKVTEMRDYVESNKIHFFDTTKFIENSVRAKEAFKARERYWEKSV